MKKNYLASLAILAVTLGASAHAAAPAAEASPYLYELGLTQHHEVYKETAIDGSKVMRETGDLLGIKGSVSRAWGATGMVTATAEFAFGNADYTGAFQGGNYGDVHVGGIGRNLFEATGVYQHTDPTWNGIFVKGGLGYRRLNDNLQDAGPAGYKRTNERLYAIVGVDYDIQTPGWTITPSVEYKHSLWSRQNSDVLGGLKHRQHGNGAELSVAFAQKGELHPVVIRPFYRAWRLDHSNQVAGTYEPKNDTREIGVDVGWRF